MIYTSGFSEIISIILMLGFYVATYFYAVSKIKPGRIVNLLILMAIILRMVFSLVDAYFMYLPNSGVDSVAFELTGYRLFTRELDIYTYSGDHYPRFIYIVYELFGRKPLLVRTINGAASILTGLYIYKSILLINNSKKQASMAMGCFLLFPYSLVLSSIILRESLIVLLSTLSVYNFIKYSYTKSVSDLLTSLLLLCIASVLHAGIILVATGYLYYFLRETKMSLFNVRPRRAFVWAVFGVVMVLLLLNKDIFLRKFAVGVSLEQLYSVVNRPAPVHAGSAYLQGYRVSSLTDLITFVPLKTIYLLLSPMIWDVRGFQDVAAILLDSAFYLILMLSMCEVWLKRHLVGKHKLLIEALVLSIVAVAAVFAMGTTAAGTAMRHRYKILSLLLITTSIPVSMKIRRAESIANRYDM